VIGQDHLSIGPTPMDRIHPTRSPRPGRERRRGLRGRWIRSERCGAHTRDLLKNRSWWRCPRTRA